MVYIIYLIYTPSVNTHYSCATINNPRKSQHTHRQYTLNHYLYPYRQRLQRLHRFQRAQRSLFPSSAPSLHNPRKREMSPQNHRQAMAQCFSCTCILQAIICAVYRAASPHRGRLLAFILPISFHFRTLCPLFFFFFVSFPIFCHTHTLLRMSHVY